MSKRLDLVGQKFGRLEVKEFAGIDKFNKALWECDCTCGNKKLVSGSRLVSGATKSCGCNREGLRFNLLGQKFGRLIVQDFVGRDKWGDSLWYCLCDCGNKVRVSMSSLKSGNTKSCGCITKERVTTHGQGAHGYRTAAYRSYGSMLQRCNNPNDKDYPNWGGRGITVCDRWLESFENFYEDMGPCPKGMSLDRKDNNGNYCPENCRWATRYEQMNNTRYNARYTHEGESKTLSQWARELNINVGTLWRRLKSPKWSIERALTTLVEPKGL